MDLSEFYQSERLLLDRLRNEIAGNLCLLVGNSDQSLLKNTTPQFKYTGSLFYNQHNMPDGIFSPEHLPFKEKSIDTIVLYHILPMFRFPGKVLQEAFFSLKEGGRLMIVHANAKNLTARQCVIEHFEDQGAQKDQIVYYHHSLRRVTELLKLHGFAYINAQALLPENVLKRFFCTLLPQLILGWVMVYEKQVVPLTPFGESERVNVLKSKYVVNAATMNRYKEK